MLNGSVKSIEEIADREGCSTRKVNMTLSLAFLAPEIVKAAIDGRLPRGVGISRLSDLPASWREQFRQLGIAAPVVDWRLHCNIASEVIILPWLLISGPRFESLCAHQVCK
jgi:hypothetical protein